MENRIIEIKVSDPHSHILQLLEEENREDLATWIEDWDLADKLLITINPLIETHGGKFSSPTIGAIRPSEVRALFGTYHLKVRKTVWLSLISSLPVLVDLLQHSVDPLNLVNTALSIIDVICQNLEKLEHDHWQIYLIVCDLYKRNKRPVKVEEIKNALLRSKPNENSNINEEVLKRKLSEMVKRGILKQRGEKYTGVF